MTSFIHIWFRIQKNAELMAVIRTIKYLLTILKLLWLTLMQSQVMLVMIKVDYIHRKDLARKKYPTMMMKRHFSHLLMMFRMIWSTCRSKSISDKGKPLAACSIEDNLMKLMMMNTLMASLTIGSKTCAKVVLVAQGFQTDNNRRTLWGSSNLCKCWCFSSLKESSILSYYRMSLPTHR